MTRIVLNETTRGSACDRRTDPVVTVKKHTKILSIRRTTVWNVERSSGARIVSKREDESDMEIDLAYSIA